MTFYYQGEEARFVNEASCHYKDRPKNRQRVQILEDLGSSVTIKGYPGYFDKDNIEPIDPNLPTSVSFCIGILIGCVFLAGMILLRIINLTWLAGLI